MVSRFEVWVLMGVSSLTIFEGFCTFLQAVRFGGLRGL